MITHGGISTRTDGSRYIQGQYYIDFLQYNPFIDGINDDSLALSEAFKDCKLYGCSLKLPPGDILISKSIKNMCSMFGSPGSTRFLIKNLDTSASYAQQFAFQNTNRGGSYNDLTADSITISGISIIYTPVQDGKSIFHFSNIKKLFIENVTISVDSVANPSNGIPYSCNALIDLYACVKNVKISNCDLHNETYARSPVNPWSSGGGGCIWVRNLCSSAVIGANLANATENIEISSNKFTHNTSDECLSIFGVVGMVQKVNVHHNQFYGTDINTSNLNYHTALISVFPLKHSSLGDNASVQDVSIHDNYIEDKSWFYSVMRFGNSTDTNPTNICRRISSFNNEIYAYITSDVTYSPHATWLANGSVGPDPAVSSLALRAVNVTGTFGAFNNALFSSENDKLIATNYLVFQGISGFDLVSSPTISGNFWHGVASSQTVVGGNIEAHNAAFFNVNNVSGGKANIDDSTGYVFDVSSDQGLFNYSGVKVASSGSLLNVQSSATVNTNVLINGCSGTIGNVALYAILNGSATAFVKSHCNLIGGTMAGATSGTVTSSLNKYGATID